MMTQDTSELESKIASLTSQIQAMQAKLNTALQPTSLISPSQLPSGPGTGINADRVDGINASRLPQPNTLVPLDSTGKFPSSTIPGGGITYPISVPHGGTNQTTFTATSSNTVSIPYLVTGGLQFADNLSLINMDTALGTLGIGQANPSGLQGQGLVVKATRTGTDYTSIDLLSSNGGKTTSLVGESDGFHTFVNGTDRLLIGSTSRLNSNLSVGTSGNPTHTFMVGATSDTTNVNVRINGLTLGSVSSPTPAGYLQININGTDYALALLTP